METVFSGKIRKIFFKSIAGISKACGSGESRTRTNYYGIRIVQRFTQLADTIWRVFCF